MASNRKIKLRFILHGVGRTWNDWRHPDRDVNAGTNFKFYSASGDSRGLRSALDYHGDIWWFSKDFATWRVQCSSRDF
jgi:hypothetical protein